jgi:hypothetical protein
VVAQPAGFYTCDRTGAYKASEMKRSTSDFDNNLLLYGALDHEYLKQRKHLFFPQPLGGFVGMDPKGGWSHIQIPGMVSQILTYMSLLPQTGLI